MTFLDRADAGRKLEIAAAALAAQTMQTDRFEAGQIFQTIGLVQ